MGTIVSNEKILSEIMAKVNLRFKKEFEKLRSFKILAPERVGNQAYQQEFAAYTKEREDAARLIDILNADAVMYAS